MQLWKFIFRLYILSFSPFLSLFLSLLLSLKIPFSYKGVVNGINDLKEQTQLQIITIPLFLPYTVCACIKLSMIGQCFLCIFCLFTSTISISFRSLFSSSLFSLFLSFSLFFLSLCNSFFLSISLSFIVFLSFSSCLFSSLPPSLSLSFPSLPPYPFP